MDLSLNEEQQLLKQSVASFVQDRYSVEHRRALRETELAYDTATWQQFAELGWLSLPFAEEDGGIGAGVFELMVVMEELGRGLLLEPYLVNIAVCGAFLRRASAAQRRQHLPALMAGESQWAFAFAEQASRYKLNNVTLTARKNGDSFVLNGEKIAVLNGHSADRFILSARCEGDSRDAHGVSLFIVDAASAGITRRSYPLVDGSRGADVCFEQVQVDGANVLGEHGGGLALMNEVIAEAIVAIGAEAVGAMDALLEQTVDYSKTREQFGQPIGRFQALQHLMADMYLQCQSARSLLYHAAIAHAEQRTDRLKAASALKHKIGEAGRFVAQQAVQIHGGMGMTDELAIGHYLKRLLLLNILFGDSEHHLRQYAAL